MESSERNKNRTFFLYFAIHLKFDGLLRPEPPANYIYSSKILCVWNIKSKREQFSFELCPLSGFHFSFSIIQCISIWINQKPEWTWYFFPIPFFDIAASATKILWNNINETLCIGSDREALYCICNGRTVLEFEQFFNSSCTTRNNRMYRNIIKYVKVMKQA